MRGWSDSWNSGAPPFIFSRKNSRLCVPSNNARPPSTHPTSQMNVSATNQKSKPNQHYTGEGDQEVVRQNQIRFEERWRQSSNIGSIKMLFPQAKKESGIKISERTIICGSKGEDGWRDQILAASSWQHCIALHCIALHCIALHCIGAVPTV